MPTLQQKLAATNNRPSGFDYLRVGLATAVIFFHSLDLMAGRNVAYSDFYGALQPFYDLMLPMFFALSGFLVAGSFARSASLVSFLGLRLLRLFPALFVETILSAIVIGPLFTTLSCRDYFSSRIFAHYFMNTLGDIHYILPGVFQTHPFTTVNAQLWTEPWEIGCYGAVACLAVIGAARQKYFLLLAIIGINLAALGDHLGAGPQAGALTLPGIVLVQSFLCGLCLYAFRASIPWRAGLAAGALAVFLLLAAPRGPSWGDYLLPLPGAYVTVFIGLANPRRAALITSGDYSYGIYLYGYPVQQSVLAVFGHPLMPWWLNFLVSMAVVAALAFGSWHLVETQAARGRGALFALEARYLRLRAGARAWLAAPKPPASAKRVEREADG